MNKKERIDVLLVERGLVETREKAKRTVMAGLVFSNGQRLDKPGMKIDSTLPIEVKGDVIPYVGRGGLKLEKAIDTFDIDITNRVMIDVGSSTGGFTDCALQKGVKFVYAVDVGYNQLAWKLRIDDRVKVMERTNFRYATEDMFTYPKPNFATVDVSFISLKKMLPVLKKVLLKDSDIIALVKPQFEAGRDKVGKKGIVRDANVHLEVLHNIIHFAEQLELQVNSISYSPITGTDGNIEFLLHLRLTDEMVEIVSECVINDIVERAHKELKK